jgi:membrane associated rhomboid family serine protease
MFVPLYDHNPLEYIPRPYVNWSLITVTVLVWVVFQSGAVLDGFLATAWGLGLTPALVLDGLPPPPEIALVPEWATLVTYAFAHGNFWHLAGNLVFLWVFGDNVEDALGHLRYLAFYLISAAAGGFVHMMMMPDSQAPLIGASGAVAGVVAAYLLLHPRTRLWILVLGRIPLRITARWPLVLWVVLQVTSVLVPRDDAVAWWAHIGGLVAGAALVTVMLRPGVPLFDRNLAVENRTASVSQTTAD